MRMIRPEALAKVESHFRYEMGKGITKKIKCDFNALSLRLINRLRIEHEELFTGEARARGFRIVSGAGGAGGTWAGSSINLVPSIFSTTLNTTSAQNSTTAIGMNFW